MYRRSNFPVTLICVLVLMSGNPCLAREPESLIHTESSQPLADVIKTINRDTGNHVVLDQGAGEVAVAPIAEQPFWAALDQICHDHGLGWSWKDRATLKVDRSPTQSGAIAYEKGVRVAVRQVASSPKLTRLQFEIDVEPRLYPFFLQFQGDDFSLENGDQTWPVLSPDAQGEVFFVNENHAEFTVDFVGRPEMESVAKVAGEFELMLPAERVELIWNVNEDMNQTKSTMSHKVQLFTHALMPEDDELKPYLEFIVTMPDEMLRTFASHRLGLLHQDVALQSGAEAEWIRPEIVDIVRTQRNSQQVRYLFPPMELTSAARVRYGVPEKIESMPVKFSIDLPLNQPEDDDQTQD